MKRDKYVGMDVYQSMTVVAVMDAEGKIVLETMVPTAASRIRELIESLRGPSNQSCFEELCPATVPSAPATGKACVSEVP